jgi:hypothetical protein
MQIARFQGVLNKRRKAHGGKCIRGIHKIFLVGNRRNFTDGSKTTCVPNMEQPTVNILQTFINKYKAATENGISVQCIIAVLASK